MRLIKKNVKNIFNAAGSFYYRVRAWHPVWFYILNWKGRALHNTLTGKLSSEELRVLAELKEKGISTSHVSHFFSPDVFNELRTYVENRWNDDDVQAHYKNRGAFFDGKRVTSKEFYLANLWKGPHVLDISHPFLRFSMQEPILRIIHSYLGTFSKFRYFSLEATLPMPGGQRNYASQQWHRDPDDKKLVKVFLYLNDIDNEAGPFHYLRYSHNSGKWRHLFPQEPPRGNAKTTEDIDPSIPKQDVITATGKAGTLIFCDTSGLHKGGYASSKIRFMYTGAYLTNASPWPIRYQYAGDFHAGSLSPEVRYMLDNDPKQQEPRFY